MFQLTPIVSRLYTTFVISFLCLNTLAQKVETVASFSGGVNAWRRYLEHNLCYPEAAQKNNTQGVIRVEMLVDKEGKISEVKALNDPGDGLANEAMRVVKMGPDWIPAMQDGKPVTYRFVQTVTFRLASGMGAAFPTNPNRYNQSIVVKTARLYNGKAIENIVPTYDSKGADIMTVDRKTFFVNREEALQQFGLIITDDGFIAPEDAKVIYYDNNGIALDNYEGLKFVGGRRQFRVSSLTKFGTKAIEADKQPVFVLNGKEATANDVQQLSLNEVRGSNLLKFQDEPAMAKFGNRGKNGLLILSTKVAFPDNYLYLLNGKESMNEEIAKLPSGTLKSMRITTGNRGFEKYGEKAKYGVVVVDTGKREEVNMSDRLFTKTEEPASFPGGDEG